MAIGYGAGLGGAAGKRNLNRVDTFKDIAKDRRGLMTAGPSMARPSGIGYSQPGGFGPAGTGGARIRKTADAATRTGAGQPHTTSGYITTPTTAATAPTKTPYSEARTGEIPGAYGAPAGGLPQRSPWFGAGDPFGGGGFGAPPTTPEVATEEEAEAQAVAGGSPSAPTEWGVGDIGGLGDTPDLGGLDFDKEWDPLTGRFVRPLEEERDAGGVTPEEQRGIAFGETPKTAGETVGEINEDERLFNELIDELDVSQEEAQRKLDAAFAQAQRRNAEVNAAMGTSVSGGYAGTTTASTLGYLQQMQDMFADFQTRKTNLQLQFLDKKMSRDFQRETQERQEAANLIQTMLASGQEIPQDLLDRAGDLAPAGAAASVAGGGGAAPEGTTGEPGALKNEAGDLLAGPGGLGTSGTVRADPLSGEGEAYQWYARGTGGQYEYYRLDEDGNEVLFEAEPGGARFPGDMNLTARTTADTGAPGWEMGNHPEYGNDGIVKAAGSDYVGYRGGEVVPFLEYVDDKYSSDNTGNQALTMEIGLFISWYKSQNEGEGPTWEEMEQHAERTGLLNKATSEYEAEQETKDRDQYGEEETAYAERAQYEANMRDKYGEDWEEMEGA